jgi:hypothetical protein
MGQSRQRRRLIVVDGYPIRYQSVVITSDVRRHRYYRGSFVALGFGGVSLAWTDLQGRQHCPEALYSCTTTVRRSGREMLAFTLVAR